MQLVRSLFFGNTQHNSLDQMPSTSLSAAVSGTPDQQLLVSQATRKLFPDSALATVPQRKILGAAQGNACSHQLNQEYPLLLTPTLRSSLSKVPQDKREWYINLFLMMDVYKRTQDPKLQHLISFLVLNYLAKAAPIVIDSRDFEPVDELIAMFQRSESRSEMIPYNREGAAFDFYFREEVVKKLVNSAGKQFFITDTELLAPFFPLCFSVAKGKAQDWEKFIISIILEHVKRHSENPFETYLPSLILFNLNSLLADYLFVSEDGGNDKLFEEKIRQFEQLLYGVIERAVVTISNSKQFANSEDQESFQAGLRNFILEHVICVCCGEVKGIGILHILPVFVNQKFYFFDKKLDSRISRKFERAWTEIDSFLNGTGMRLGSVSGREKIPNFFSLEALLDKMEISISKMFPLKPKFPIFEKKSDFVCGPIFRTVAEVFMRDQGHSYVTTLGKSTTDLLLGLFVEIDEAKWKELNSNAEYRQLIQMTLYKIECQLAYAETQVGNFNAFTNIIECIHYEMAALLAIFSPFTPQDFPFICQQHLTIIPESLKGFVQAGLTKSGMNTFAGISVLAGVDSIKAIHKKSHFELFKFVGAERDFEKVLADPTIEKVDLLFTEFHHNISLYSDHTTYSTVDVIRDIERLLAAKPLIKHLTVGIDGTIDYINSLKIEALFKHFEPLILAGKLNFIVCCSGQKTHMFGMDDYYASPCYMVNNGGPQWDAYQKLFSSKALATDLLSTQWFCLVHKYALKSLDEYKSSIFKNTKKILANVPLSLKPSHGSDIVVCELPEDSESCLIDIKCFGKKTGTTQSKIESLLFETLVPKGIRVHRRAGYGYFNANINSYSFGLDTKYLSTIRINPGINEEENGAIIEFLKKIALI